MTTATVNSIAILIAAAASLQANGPMAPANSPAPKSGVTVCYDYAYYRGTGCGVSKPLGPNDLINHSSVKTREFYPNAMDARGHMRPGDWVVTTGGHAGYVNSRGGIDHFHQVYGESGKMRNPRQLPGYDGHGGLLMNDNLHHFVNSRYRPLPNQGVHVLHR